MVGMRSLTQTCEQLSEGPGKLTDPSESYFGQSLSGGLALHEGRPVWGA